MEQTVDQRDFDLLSGDRYTFSVLSRVLHYPCRVVRTDHERLILCHTTDPYPVWLWTPDGLTEADCIRAWQLAQEACPLGEGYRYNLKYELADAFIRLAAQEGLTLRIATNMFAYDCPQPVAPAIPADGQLHRCTMDDLEEAAQLIDSFHAAVAQDRSSLEHCRQQAKQRMEGSGFFLWKNAQGETAACCSLIAEDGLGCVGGVYTKPEYRRRHYAQHLVYQVTRLAAEQGLMPMLYTDADYAASNACYEKIGYVLRGKLCTIEAKP